jgi:hypothetical protein
MDRNKVSHGSPAGEEDERARKRGRPTVSMCMRDVDEKLEHWLSF